LLLFTAKHGLVFCDEFMNSYWGKILPSSQNKKKKVSLSVIGLCVFVAFFLYKTVMKRNWSAETPHVFIKDDKNININLEFVKF